jgi:para-aminobenzoate synthetase component 1
MSKAVGHAGASHRPAHDQQMAGWAVVGGRLATQPVDITSDPAALDSSGFWVVVQTFEGALTCVRMAEVTPWSSWAVPPALGRSSERWVGSEGNAWRTGMGRDDYLKGVETIRERIAAGDVYQVNLCRLLSADLPQPPDLRALGSALASHNPAPYAATIDIPAAGLHIASASPELFLGRDGDRITSKPIKGTGRTAADLTPKDEAENVMIVDLVRNDLSRVCEPGSVEVPTLLEVEAHPGLVHLVSTVTGRLARGPVNERRAWAELLDATSPPGSVSGAPKSSALRLIDELEPVPRGAYCGAIGWVDADTKQGALAVGIRTFEWRDGRLHLGTGAGITWGSDPAREWDETELKVHRLLEAVQ